MTIDLGPRPAPTVSRLADLARGIAQNRALWEGGVRFDPEQRLYALLERTEEYEAWLLTWLPGQGTGMHDHGDSAGAFAVVRGTLQESVVDPRSTSSVEPVVRALERGRVRAFGPTHIHDVTNLGPAPAVSVHVYTPTLTTMRRYDVRERRLVVVAVEQAGADW